MEMKKQNSDWHGLKTVMKGDVGERIVKSYLVGNGFIPYSPCLDCSHPFDLLVAGKDKKTIFIADSKAKAKRKWYPDTGINVKNYNEYIYIQDKYRIDVFLFFIDEDSKTVYGNFLRKLDSQRTLFHNNKELSYPMQHGNIRYFPMAAMKHISDLSSNDIRELQQFTTKKSDYK